MKCKMFILAVAAALLAGCTGGNQASNKTGESQDVDESVDFVSLMKETQEKYGTTIPETKSIVVKADSTTSITLDLSGKEAMALQQPTYETRKGIVYKKSVCTDGENKGAQLDLKMNVYYHPKSDKKTPCVLAIPGGGFVSCSLSSMNIARNYIANQGFAVAIAEYHVIGQGVYKDAVADVNDAIRYIKAHADEYNIDAEHISLMGNSAGGYMVALTALSKGTAAFKGTDNLNFNENVDCVIDLYGLSDLTQVAADYDQETQAGHQLAVANQAQFVNGVYSGKSITDDLAEAEKANPITYVTANAPAFLLMHGDADMVVSPSQTVMLHNALIGAGVSSTRYSLKGANHGTSEFDTKEALDIMLNFLKQHQLR